MFLDLGHFRKRCAELKSSFQKAGVADKNITHTYAVKALPLPRILDEAHSFGFGAETASEGEMEICRKLSKIDTNKIIFDSPCKKTSEIEYCFQNKISFNIDNLQELERVAAIIGQHGNLHGLNIGFRVNPAVGMGSIAVTSTGAADSKFGINIDQFEDQLSNSYKKYPWLNMIHCHVGSQGCTLDQIADGVKRIVDFAEKHEQIKVVDIGGGMPVNYEDRQDKPSFDDIVNCVKKKVPQLFSDKKYHLMTEFGRSLVQKCGWIASKVEYTKESGGKNIAAVHAGANLLVRTAYLPHIWKHHVTVHNKDGTVKQVDGNKTNLVKYDIAGPLCFSGDFVAKDVQLPYIEPGDFLVIHDAGGYTYGMYSRYNSKYAPPIYGYYGEKGSKINPQDFDLQLLKKAETGDDILRFWGK